MIKLKALKDRILHLFKRDLFRHTLWMLFAKLSSLLMQIGYFIAIARVLGTQEYGIFISITALASIAFSFAALGSGDILIQEVSRNRGLFKQYWGKALITTFLFSSLLILFCFLISKAIFPKNISSLVIFLFLLSDLLALAIFDIATKAFMAVDLIGKTSQLYFLAGITKLLAALALASFFEKPGIVTWAFLYFFSAAIVAAVGVFLVNRTIGSPQLALAGFKPDFKQGVHFSIGLSADTINASIDKTMLGSFATLEATGLYAAAYRFIIAGYVPIQSLLGATYAKFFQKGATGITGSLNFAKRLLPLVSAYGIVAMLGLLAFAPFVPYILGEDYAGTTIALRWLAPYLLLIALQAPAEDALTGAGLQKIRSTICVATAVFNVLTNLWLIPLYSWQGAIWTTLASDSLKLLCLWAVILYFYKQQIQTRH
jgi:O-antigen/teichoic acid export membrane protein